MPKDTIIHGTHRQKHGIRWGILWQPLRNFQSVMASLAQITAVENYSAEPRQHKKRPEDENMVL